MRKGANSTGQLIMNISRRIRPALAGLLLFAAGLAAVALLSNFDLRAGNLQVCSSASVLRAQMSRAAFVPTAPSLDAIGDICNP